MRQPLIGITCARGSGGSWRKNSVGHYSEFVFDVYCRGVLASGGVPLLIPTTQNRPSIEILCKSLDGLILSGGADIHPRHYGQEPHPGIKDIDAARDEMETALVKQALRYDLPLLAICRGIQLLNVALGGTLYQDIASESKSPLLHNPAADRDTVTHTVRIVSETQLYAIIKRRTLWVNSKHHP
jgi:putative glutamine amidotransferase